jgi:acetyl-CoA C-acetyltransferase
MRSVGIIGVAAHPVLQDGLRRSLEEVIYDTVQECLRDAGVTPDDYDGIVVASNDQYDGRAISMMAASGSVGGVDRDILSTPSSAEHALVMGVLRIASHQFETQLVVAWGPLEAGSLSDVERLAADPYYHRALPQDDLAAHALQASVLLSRHPGAENAALDVLLKNRRNGLHAYPQVAIEVPDPEAVRAGPVRAWPLRDGMLAPRSTGIVALLLASDEFIAARPRRPVAWLEGMGWATEASFLGDRDLSVAPALATAAAAAYRQAGITNPLEQLDLAEVADPTPYQELIVRRGLGFVPVGAEVGSVAPFLPGGTLPMNLSGGALSRHPVFCSGLVAIAEVANQLRGCAGRHQLPGARRGLAHAASGVAMQYQSVFVFAAGAGGAQ